MCGVDEGLGRKSRFGGGFGSLAELPRSFFFFFFVLRDMFKLKAELNHSEQSKAFLF